MFFLAALDMSLLLSKREFLSSMTTIAACRACNAVNAAGRQHARRVVKRVAAAAGRKTLRALRGDGRTANAFAADTKKDMHRFDAYPFAFTLAVRNAPLYGIGVPDGMSASTVMKSAFM